MNEVKIVSHSKKGTQQKGKKAKPSGKPSTSEQNQPKKPKKLYDQIIFRDWCKACGICSAFCPKDVIGRDESGAPVFEYPEECIGCRFCELRCPDFAITVKERDIE